MAINIHFRGGHIPGGVSKETIRAAEQELAHRLRQCVDTVKDGDRPLEMTITVSLRDRGSKQFKVVSVSSNANSFGLRGMILMAADGEAWQVAANHLLVRRHKAGDTLAVPDHDFTAFGFELPEQLPNAPAKVLEQLWPNGTNDGEPTT